MNKTWQWEAVIRWCYDCVPYIDKLTTPAQARLVWFQCLSHSSLWVVRAALVRVHTHINVFISFFFSQTCLRHPECPSSQHNRDAVFKQMRRAMDLIQHVVQEGIHQADDRSPTANVNGDSGISLAQNQPIASKACKEFDVRRMYWILPNLIFPIFLSTSTVLYFNELNVLFTSPCTAKLVKNLM